MSGQREMFEQSYEGLRPPRRNFDPQPSHEAAAWLWKSGKLTEQGFATLGALAAWEAGGTDAPTSQELAGEDTDARYRYARRLPELAQAGYVEKRAARACRVTGRSATTWAVTAAGRAVLRGAA